MRHTRILPFVAMITLLVASSALAQDADTAVVAAPEGTSAPTGGNLLGMRGLARMVAASTHPKNHIALGTDFQFFTASEFLNGPGTNKYDHSRLVNTYSIAWAPLSFLEAAFALHVISDNSELPNSQSDNPLQVAVGDPQIVVKGGHTIIPGLSLGGLLDVRFPSGAGFFEASPSAANIFLALLGSYRVSDALPLSIHLNAGFLIDGSDSLFDNPDDLDEPQRFAAQLSSFNRAIVRLGVEYETKWVGPFIELSLEPFVGTDAPGFGDSPGRLTVGARGWVGARRGLQIMAAADIGLMGVGPRDVDALPTGKYAFTLPRINFMVRLSYRFDPFYTETKVVGGKGPGTDLPLTKAGPKLASISGKIVDMRTNEPIHNARVRIVGEASSALAVARDGSFTTHKLPVGPRTLVATAEGYSQLKLEVSVQEGGTKVAPGSLQLTPKVTLRDGTLRVVVKSRTSGKPVSGATILIPELDKTLKTASDGSVTVKVQPGEYTIVCSAPRMRQQRKKVRIPEGETVIRNIDLYR